MARLFSKDYHEQSSTWYFNHAVIPLQDGDLLFWQYLDELNRMHFHFYPTDKVKSFFANTLDIIYSPDKQKIISYECSECKEETNCRHYLSILRYAYYYISSDVVTNNSVEIYQGNALVVDEKKYVNLHNAKIWLEGIYNPDTDKIRFYYDELEYFDIRSFAIKQETDAVQNSESPKMELATIWTDFEMRFFEQLYIKRCSISDKGKFISVYKQDFGKLLAYMQDLHDRFAIKETKEPLIFNPANLELSLRIEYLKNNVYKVKPLLMEEVSCWFSGNPTWLMFRNTVRHLFLPFRQESIDALFNNEWYISNKDLVYFRTLVHKQLSVNGVYLDFDERITLPLVHINTPKIHLMIHRHKDSIVMEGKLHYNQNLEIPLSVVRFNASLISLPQQTGVDEWFYIPPEIFNNVHDIMQKLPNPEYNRLNEYSQLTFTGEENITALKQTVHELTEDNWEIEIDEDLKKEFIYKVTLQVQLDLRSSEDIDWFTYDIKYRYKDFSFTQEELRKFFKSKQQFLHTADGRLVFISNPEIFQEMENLVRISEVSKDNVYRSRLNRLPYFQRLLQENQAIKIYGDSYLERMFNALLNRKNEKEDKLPTSLNAIMRGYQKTGYAWIKMLEHYHLHGILADEMGLGKTLQALTVITEAPEDSVSLVICPKTLLYNWAAEIEKFHTNIPYAIYERNKAERLALLNRPNIRLFILSYSIVLNDITELSQYNYHYIVLDEAQHIKNVSAQRTHAIKKLKATHRLALSGTPIENDVTELWSLFDFLMPGYFGTLKRFKDEYFGEQMTPAQQHKLNLMTSPFILRRLKKEVLLELPDKMEQISFCKLTSLQEKIYLQILDSVKKSVLADNQTESFNYIHVLAALTKLRQTCNHPSLVNPDILPNIEASAKTEQLLELVQDAIESGHKILVFSQFVQMLKIIKEILNANNIQYEYLDGQTKDRITHIQNFNNNHDLKVFLISLKTGGTGLNLTAADTVILVDPWWNPMIENQAIDRTHRIGQTQKVQVIRLVTKGTVEEKILQLQRSKLDLFTEIIDDGQRVLKSMERDDIRLLFEY